MRESEVERFVGKARERDATAESGADRELTAAELAAISAAGEKGVPGGPEKPPEKKP